MKYNVILTTKEIVPNEIEGLVDLVPETILKETCVASFEDKYDAYMHICRKVHEWTRLSLDERNFNKEDNFIGVRIDEEDK